MPNFLTQHMPEAATLTIILSLGSAVAYTGSMAAMKVWTASPSLTLALIIAMAIAIGVVFEVQALRAERLGVIYVTILGIEVVLISFVSTVLFGETFSMREIVGCALVIGGTALAWA